LKLAKYKDMGFLTTITIRNDALDEIKKHPEEFAKNVLNACSGNMRGNMSSDKEFGLGSHANMTICQEPKHADAHTTYVHMGNTVCEISAYSSYTEHLMKNHTEFFDDMLDHMEYTVKKLKEKRKAMKK